MTSSRANYMRFLAYILNQTGRNFRQTWGTQFMTLMTVTLSVLIFAFFFLIYINMMSAGNRLGDDIRLVVYLEDEIAAPIRPQIEKKIYDFLEVEKIVFVSRAEAFSRLRDQLGKDSDVLDDLGNEFLPPSIEVHPYKSLKNLTQIHDFSEYLLTLPGAMKVQYGQSWIKRFGHFIDLLRLIVILSGVLLILSMTFIVSYTIRLTVVARREELEVLRLLGATNSYIRLPLLFEGLMQGFLGSALGLTALFFLYRWISGRFSGSALLSLMDFTFFPPLMTGIILFASILLCTGGSLISIRKFLRI